MEKSRRGTPKDRMLGSALDMLHGGLEGQLNGVLCRVVGYKSGPQNRRRSKEMHLLVAHTEMMIWRHGHGEVVTQGQEMNVCGPGMTCGWCWVHTDPKVCPKSRSPLLTLPMSNFLVISTLIEVECVGRGWKTRRGSLTNEGLFLVWLPYVNTLLYLLKIFK